MKNNLICFKAEKENKNCQAFMKQITAEHLLELVSKSLETPVVLNNYSITGILKKVEIADVYFIDCQFFNFGVISSSFTDCKFIHTKITNANFEHTQFSNCIFQDSSIFSTIFLTSQISTSKIANLVASKVIFDASEIQYTKTVCSSLIATKFLNCKLLDAFFEYTTLDASIFDKSEIYNSMFLSSNMRGVHITSSKIENTLMDFINFNDSTNASPSEFFIPARTTNIRGNEIENLTITNTVLNKSLKEFIKHSNKGKNDSHFASVFHKTDKKEKDKKFVEALKQETKQKLQSAKATERTEPKRDLFPHEATSGNVGSAVTFFLQAFLTIFIVTVFGNFYSEISSIFYKSIPNIIKFPISFIEEGIEIHQFAFYFSLLYFAFSGILMCVNVVCIRGVKSFLLVWLYRGQSFATLGVMAWLYWKNLSLHSGTISMLNLIFATYFFIMIVQSFGTKSMKKTA